MEKRIKQVILVRRDLNMRLGKIASQVAHASLAVFFNKDERLDENKLIINLTDDEKSWVRGMFTKIVLGVETENDLLRAHDLAKAANLNVALIEDCGATEFHGMKTNTTLAIGPNDAAEIDKITGPNGVIKTKLI